jgi:hypothetical protein
MMLPWSPQRCREPMQRVSCCLGWTWTDHGAPPARDATGEIDYGHIEGFEWKPGCYRLEGSWGFMEVAAGDVQVTIDEANS